jgi:uncharacterized membrane protein YgaE (UPF0421/DUF939 family)
MARKQSDFVMYILKCLIGVAVGFYLYRKYPEIGVWCLISIVSVLSPDRKDAMKLALVRIEGNLVGAGIGLALFFIHPMNLLMLSLGVTLTIITCSLLKLQEVTRPAAVAVIIILLHQKGQYFWDVALERAGGVLAGCLIAMMITYIFHEAITKFKW